MAKPNYSFEKRQRELAKKKKKEEKAQKKAQGGSRDELDPNAAAAALAGPVPDLPEGEQPAGGGASPKP